MNKMTMSMFSLMTVFGVGGGVIDQAHAHDYSSRVTMKEVNAKSIFVGKIDQKPLAVAVDFLKDELPVGDAEGKQETELKQERIYCSGQEKCSLLTRITFELDGLNDDSVKKKQHILLMKQNTNQTWAIIDQKTEYACYKNRGHKELSAQPCQ